MRGSNCKRETDKPINSIPLTEEEIVTAKEALKGAIKSLKELEGISEQKVWPTKRYRDLKRKKQS
jgi:hypothetical protein